MIESRKQEVISKVNQLIELTEKKLGISLPAVEVRFDLRGRCAGQASRMWGKYAVRFNIDMMQTEAWDHIINNTVPHEIAHIVCYFKYNAGGHGAIWKRICAILGGNSKRCHNEEFTFARGKTYEYVTSSGKKVTISQTRHNKILRGVVYTFKDGSKISFTSKWTIVA